MEERRKQKKKDGEVGEEKKVERRGKMVAESEIG